LTGDNHQIWSHAWNVQIPITRNNKQIFSYTIEPEYWVYPGDMTCGVFCHEMGHSIFGIPDLYDNDFSSAGIGNWSVMGTGSWNGNFGNRPAEPDAWSRIKMGFATAVVPTTNVNNIALPPVETYPTIYRLWTNGASGNEYYLIENRQQTGYDSTLPGNGILIYHIDDQVYDNYHEWYPNHTTTGHYRVAIEQADGVFGLEQNMGRGDAGDPYPGTSNISSFNHATIPGSDDYSGLPTGVSVHLGTNVGQTYFADLGVTPNWLVTKPCGSECHEVGSTMDINWMSPASVANARIEINRTYPSANWETILTTTANDGHETWVVCGTPTMNARIRVSSAINPSQGDTSDANFSIQTPSHSLSANFDCPFPPYGWRPTGVWSGYSPQHIDGFAYLNYRNLPATSIKDTLLTPLLDLTGQIIDTLIFNTSYAMNRSALDTLAVYGRYGTSDWKLLWKKGGSNLSNHTYVDSILETKNVIDIPAEFYTSHTMFAFVGLNGHGNNIYLDSVYLHSRTDTLRMTSQNLSTNLAIGSFIQLEWLSGYQGGNVRIDINRNYPGGAWESIYPSTDNVGSAPWCVSGPPSNAVRFRVLNTINPSQGDTCDANCSIVYPVITSIQHLNGGEEVFIGQDDTLRWSINAPGNSIRILLNRNYPSGSWDSITRKLENTGEYIWTPSAPPTNNARIRFEFANDSGVGRTSGNNFNIHYGKLTLTSHSVSDTICVGTLDTLYWNESGLSGTAHISLNRHYPTGSWEQIATQIPVTDGRFIWQVDSCENTIRFAISSDTYSEVSDTSNADTKILTTNLRPATPSHVQISQVGNSAFLQWDRVNRTATGYPIQITGYRIYTQDHYLGPQTLLTTITNDSTTFYTHLNGFSTSRLLYTITTYK